MQVGFLSRCLILLKGKLSRWSIFGVQVFENGTRPSRFLADCNDVAADRISRVASRESFREQGGGMRTDAGFRWLSVSTLTGCRHLAPDPSVHQLRPYHAQTGNCPKTAGP